MVNNLSYEVATGSMHLLANIGRKGFLDGLGVARADFDRLIGDDPWLSTDRNRMTTILHTLINASVDSMGLPRFNLPAEYIAAGICVFVSPVNVHAACIFSAHQHPGTAEDMGRMASVQPVGAQQIFALVSQLYKSPSRNSARVLFEKNTGLALGMVEAAGSPVNGGRK